MNLPDMSSSARRRGARYVAGIVIGILLASGIGIAVAYWLSTDSGNNAAAVADSVNAGQQPTATVSGRDVSLGWAASTTAAGQAVSGYTVARYTTLTGGSPVAASGSCAGTISALTCTEAGVAPGTWFYGVTPVISNWRGAESSRRQAVVASSTLSLTTTTFSYRQSPAGSTNATVASFKDNESITYCLDGSSLPCAAGATLGSDIIPASGGTKTTNGLVIPAATSAGSHTIYALGGSGSSASAAITVNKATTTTSLTVSPSTVAYGNEQTVAFTSTVTPQFAGTPTGSVDVKNGSTVLCTITLSAGSGSCNIGATTLTVSGSPYTTITAVYNADANFTGSTSSNQSLTITKATTTTSVSESPTSVVYGNESTVVFTATTTPQFGLTVSNGDTITVQAGTASCTVTLPATTCSIGNVALTPNGSAYAVSATYNGNSNLATSTGNAATGLTITKATPTIAVTHSPTSPTLGQTVTFTATVTGPSGGATPSGAMSWNVAGQKSSCSSNTALTGATNVATATCVITASTAGTQNATASVATDSNYLAAGPSSIDTFTVAKATPTINVTHAPSSPTLGQSVTFTATVTGPTAAATPTGAIAWSMTGSTCSSTTPLSGTTNVATATCALTASTATTYSASASVASDTNYEAPGPSSSDGFSVSKATPTISVAASPSSPTLGQTVVFTATVTGPTGAATPGGALTWALSGGPTTCASTTPLSGSNNVGTATCTITASNAANYSTTANMASDSNYNTSGTSVPATFTVNKASQTITFTGPGTGTVGGTATLSGTGGASGNPVVFTVDASSGAGVCNVTGTNGTTLNYTAIGTCVVDANQAGDANYNAATQVQQSVTVTNIAITAATRVSGTVNVKHTFSGTGGTAGSTVTVSVCATNNFPSCTPATSATATVQANGTWTTATSTTNITAGATYYARAVQTSPSKTSAVFQFVA